MDQIKQATLEDLARLAGHRKAELIDGTIIEMSPTGFLPSYVAGEIYASLRDYARRTKRGYAIGDNTGFVVDLQHRRSFSPDAAYYTGLPTGMRFLEGAPVFAVEVRSENDYGKKAERELAAKRADYFAAGTLVVWDIDVLSDDIVRVYRADAPTTPTMYRRGDIAEAEPAVPGWTMAVDDFFPYQIAQEEE
jgi:Uma2 family endonuclease